VSYRLYVDFKSALIFDFRHLKEWEDGDTLSLRQFYRWTGDITDLI
jgi:hypothetical protein